MEASMMASASRTLVLAVTLPPKATTRGQHSQEPNRARGQRLDMLRAEPGILSDSHIIINMLLGGRSYLVELVISSLVSPRTSKTVGLQRFSLNH